MIFAIAFSLTFIFLMILKKFLVIKIKVKQSEHDKIKVVSESLQRLVMYNKEALTFAEENPNKLSSLRPKLMMIKDLIEDFDLEKVDIINSKCSKMIEILKDDIPFFQSEYQKNITYSRSEKINRILD